VGKGQGKPQENKQLAESVETTVNIGAMQGILSCLSCYLTIQYIAYSRQNHNTGSPDKVSGAVNQPCNQTKQQTGKGQYVWMDAQANQKIANRRYKSPKSFLDPVI